MTAETFARAVHAARSELADDPELLRHQAHNVLAAITWLAANAPDRAAELVIETRLAIAGILGYRPLIEGVDRLLAHRDEISLAPAVLRWRGVLAHRTGDVEAARTMWEEARARSSGDDRALAATNLSHIEREKGDFARSTALLEAAEESAASLHVLLSIHAQRSATEVWSGEMEQAHATITRARSALAEHGGKPSVASQDALGYVLLNESVAWEHQGAFDAAVDSARQGVRVARGIGSAALEARLLEQLALTLGWRGSHALAATVGEEALGISETIGDVALVGTCTGTLAFVLWRADRSEEAAALVHPVPAPGGLSQLVSALVLIDQGAIHEARGALSALIDHAEAEGEPLAEADARIALAGIEETAVERRVQLDRAAAAYGRAGHWRGAQLPAAANLRAGPVG